MSECAGDRCARAECRFNSIGNGLSNDVSVIDTQTNKVIATIKAGAGPWGIALQ